MDLKPGSRWKSAVCNTEIVVVRPPASAAALACGGSPMIPFDAAKPADARLDAAFASGCHAGKRYFDDATGLEALCTRPGEGSLAIDGRPVAVKEAKKLPSSD